MSERVGGGVLTIFCHGIEHPGDTWSAESVGARLGRKHD